MKLPNGKRERRQKQLLMYTTSDIHALFNEEHPDIVIGLTKFRELRPEHVMPMTVNDQIVCACRQCENTQLLFDAVKSSSVIPVDTSNLHQLLKATVCDLKNEQCCSRQCSSCGVEGPFSRFGAADEKLITVSQWQPDDLMGGYMNKRPAAMPLNEAVECLKQRVEELAVHEYGKNCQLGEISHLKQNLREGHVVLQYDSSENFTCKQRVKIQSAYYATIMVTLFTAVAWYKDNDGIVIARNYVVVTDDNSYDKRSIYHCNKALITDLRSEGVEVQHVHNFSDGQNLKNG